MSFSTALSGLNAASNSLAVAGNNIANANTSGFKKSRSEFADVYGSSLAGVSSITPGQGVRVINDAQQFKQGSLNATGNNLDLAISGQGFFTLAASADPGDLNNLSYTRAGVFKLNKDGVVVNGIGRALLTFKPNGTTAAQGFSTGVMQPLTIKSVLGKAKPTDNVSINVNLDATKPAIPTTPAFDPTNLSTFTSQTSSTIYDSVGATHTITSYFINRTPVATPPVPTWDVKHYIDGTPVGGGGTLGFDSSGGLISGTTFALPPFTITPATGAAPIVIGTLSYTGTTVSAQKFGANSLTQNGLPVGQLTGIDIDNKGAIFSRFSNGGSEVLGQVALSRFSNPQGLAKLGDTAWGRSADSGEATIGAATSNNFGDIQSGSLEASNVNLSAQLVKLIVAQQAYQANAKTITTENKITQTILNI